MMFRVFSLKNILWGIFLGLAIVAVWMYCPELVSRFRHLIPKTRNKTVVMIKDQAERVKPYVGKISSKMDEMKKDVASLLSEEKDTPGTDHNQTAAEDISQTSEPEKGIKSYYAEEESRWQKLVKKPLNPEFTEDYPFIECFKAGASEYNLSLVMVLGLAGYLSNFDPNFFMDQKVGIMHIGWPNPSKSMGVQKREGLMKDPCMNIKLACRFLGYLHAKSSGEWVPALVAYRDQINVVRQEKITKEDLLFSSRLRRYAEKVLQGPFEKKAMHPLLAFNNRKIAEDFMASIKLTTGVDLWLGQRDYLYVVFIPAGNEEEKKYKATLISEKAGINEK